MDILCNNCHAFLLEVPDGINPGAAGALIQREGFIYKNAALFSDKYSSLYFCNHECGKLFYRDNIPRDPEMTKKLEEVKSKIPEMAHRVAQNMTILSNALKAGHK